MPFRSSPLQLVTRAGIIRVSVYRKLRGGSVKSSLLNGTGRSYAETWEIAGRSRESTVRREFYALAKNAKDASNVDHNSVVDE